MAYTNQTTNYGLPLPLGSDKSSFLDCNEAFPKIDAALYGAVTDISAVQDQQNTDEEEIAGIKTRLATAESDIDHCESDITTINNLLDTQASTIETNESNRLATDNNISNLFSRSYENISFAVPAIDRNALSTPEQNLNLAITIDGGALKFYTSAIDVIRGAMKFSMLSFNGYYYTPCALSNTSTNVSVQYTFARVNSESGRMFEYIDTIQLTYTFEFTSSTATLASALLNSRAFYYKYISLTSDTVTYTEPSTCYCRAYGYNMSQDATGLSVSLPSILTVQTPTIVS